MMRLEPTDETEENKGFKIMPLEAEFREQYMKVKNFLFSHKPENMEELSR